MQNLQNLPVRNWSFLFSKPINLMNFHFFWQNGEEKTFDIKRTFNEIYACSVKNLRDDQDELRKISQRFAGTTRPLTFLRENLSVKEFVQILDFIPELGKQMSMLGNEVGDAVFYPSTGEREILIFFGESENVIVPHTSSSLNLEFSSLESFSSEFCSDSESFHDKLKQIYVNKYSMTSTQESLISSSESYDIASEIYEKESESFDIESESSKKNINEKVPLIPKVSFQKLPQVNSSKAFGKSQKILLISAIVVATIVVGFIWKK